jgi:threonine dehydrogenase-like Zn-dependent dehydrogenase
LDAYREAAAPLPKNYQAWQIFGAGFENIGKDGKPVTVDLRLPEANEVLCRVDAVGLCLSDIKIINQGSEHPRLRGRDLAQDPTVLGHEAAVTVVSVGEQWKDQFRPGQRFIVQADIYYKGEGFAYGYLIPGGLAQFCRFDERALAGDEGCYLLPVQPDTGYSQSALSEPWACVEMSYNLDERAAPGEGQMLIISEEPEEWHKGYKDALMVHRSLQNLPAEGLFDDIVIPLPTPELVETLVPRLRKNGHMFLLGQPARQGTVSIDVGRVHYENIRILGGGQDLHIVERANARNDLLTQGSALFIGAGGPMGQMHVQRAIELSCGARTVVVTDLDRERLDHIENRFGELARRKGVTLVTLAGRDFADQAKMDEAIMSHAPNGFNDVCVLAPVPALVSAATRYAADDALVNLFAGIPIGKNADINLNDICRGVKILGSSGSRISDLRKILSMVESEQLNTNLSVAAIGGLNAAREGLEGVKNARFPGKVVIYPQILDLPLVSLEDIPEKLPTIAPKLGANGEWTKEAEVALLESYVG